MKVAIVHVPYQFRGGEDVHIDVLKNVYSKLSIDVEFFPKNRNKPGLSFKNTFKSLNFLSNFEDFDTYWNDAKPDFLHLHNIYPILGPRFLKWIVNTQKKAIMTTHNHRFYCANGLALRDNKICKDCFHDEMKMKPAVFNCNLELQKSIYYSIALSENHSLLKNAIKHFIAPSPYIAKELEKWGIEQNKITQITNPVEIENGFQTSNEISNDLFYAGRLSIEKGIVNLLKLTKELPDVRFVIAGDGPLKKEVIEASRVQKNISYFEKCSRSEVMNLISKSKLGILPSICNEILPTFVLECEMLGTKCLVPNLDSTTWFAGSMWNASLMNTFSVESMKKVVLEEMSLFKKKEIKTEIKQQLSVELYASKLKKVIDQL